jgi:hypothetical protein
MEDNYEIGYYANEHRGGVTHLIKNGKPVCGYNHANCFHFQQCAKFIYLNILECKRCLAKAKKILEAKH